MRQSANNIQSKEFRSKNFSAISRVGRLTCQSNAMSPKCGSDVEKKKPVLMKRVQDNITFHAQYIQ